MASDLGYGLRLIRKAPGFSAVAVASLALGVGASTIVFSLANSFVLRPIHAAAPDEIVEVFTSDDDGPLYGASSYADYESFRDAPVWDGLLASARATATVRGAGRAEVVSGVLVSGNYFEVLGLHPSRGRFFRAEETTTSAGEAVVVLSHGAWQRRFGGDPDIAGRVIELNGQPFIVIGVAPADFAGTSVEFAADFFAPATMQRVFFPDANLSGSRRARVFRILGRLRPGVGRREADAALDVVAAQLLQQDPAAWRNRAGRGRVITVLPEIESRFAGAPPGSVAFIFSSVAAAVVGLLAIACLNVATVLLARASTRRKEIAVRLAMGASRRRLVRQLLTECTLLAAAGGGLGLAFAQAAAVLFQRFRPEGVPPFDLTLDYRILLFNVGASALTVVFCGLAPALQTTRPDVNAELKDTTRTVRLRGLRFGLRSALVVTQVALSLALLATAALMLRSAYAGQTADPGFRRDHVFNVAVDLSTVPDRDRAHARFYERAVRTIRELPSVERVALASLIPMDGSNRQMTFRLENDQKTVSTTPDTNIVGPGYFSLLDIPLIRGREFTDGDHATSAAVAIVNGSMARECWNGDAIGKVLIHDRSGERYEIIGVVGDLHHRSFGEAPRPMVYLSATQTVTPRMTLHARSAVAAAALAPAIDRALGEIDPTVAVSRAETMSTYFERVTMPQRLGALGAVAVGGLELSLVVMALYGVIAFAASQRQREIGLRVALGATSRSVVTLIMRDGLVLTAAGVGFGLALAIAVGMALQSLLIGVAPMDPISVGAAVVALVIVGAAASYIPARRALRVDPSAALRAE